jgi:hypothetical protein
VAGYRGDASAESILGRRTLSQARRVIAVDYSDRLLSQDLVHLHERSAEDVVVEPWLLAHIELGWFGGVASLLVEHVRAYSIPFFRQVASALCVAVSAQVGQRDPQGGGRKGYLSILL